MNNQKFLSVQKDAYKSVNLPFVVCSFAFFLGILLICLLPDFRRFDFLVQTICGFYKDVSAQFTESFLSLFKIDLIFWLVLVLTAHFSLGFIAIPLVMILRGSVSFFVLRNFFILESNFSVITLTFYFVLSAAVFVFTAGRAVKMSGNIFMTLVFGRKQEMDLLYGRYIVSALLSLVMIAFVCAVCALFSGLLYGKVH